MDDKQALHDLDFYNQFAVKLIKKWKNITRNNFRITDEFVGGVINVLVRSEISFCLDKVPENRRLLKTPDELKKSYMLSNGIRYIKQFAARKTFKKLKNSKKRLIFETDLVITNKKMLKDDGEPFDYTACRKTKHDSILDSLINQENLEKNYKSHEINLMIEIAGLTELEKNIIHKRYWEGMNLAEIDRLNGNSHNAAFDVCERAKKKIEKAFLRCK